MDDESPAVTGLVSILSALFGVLTVLFSYTWSFIYTLLYWLALPLLYLGRGLLSIALFPLQILLKFEVSPVDSNL
jgi:vacuolar-type H+-ATPase subunit I/STV1